MIEFFLSGSFTVKAVCRACGTSIASSFALDSHMLTTGNTTQGAAAHLEQHERFVLERMKRALWDDEKCGRCRIDEAERSRPSPVSEGGRSDG